MVASVVGKGTEMFSLNGRTVLIRDVIYVSAFQNHLYSHRAHNTQMEFHRFLVLSVAASSACHTELANPSDQIQLADPQIQ